MTTISLPLPPSTNAAFVSRRVGNKGSMIAKSAAYHFWQRLVDEEAKGWNLGPPMTGPIAVQIHLPDVMRGDVDNRNKLILDALAQQKPDRRRAGASRVYVDDKQIRALATVFSDLLPADRCVVEIRPLEHWRDPLP